MSNDTDTDTDTVIKRYWYDTETYFLENLTTLCCSVFILMFNLKIIFK